MHKGNIHRNGYLMPHRLASANIQAAHLVNYICNHSKVIGFPLLPQGPNHQSKHDTKNTWHRSSDNNVGSKVTLRTCSGKTKYAAFEHVNTIDERGLKIVRNRVFDCHLSPDWRQMAIENTVSSNFRSHLATFRAFWIVAYPEFKIKLNA